MTRQIGGQADVWADRQIHGQTDGQYDRQICDQTEGWADTDWLQTDGQAG